MSDSSNNFSNKHRDKVNNNFDDTENNSDEESFNIEQAKLMLKKLEKSLECPVCYNIPRDLPVSSCKAGHIVCKPCRSNLEDCPTCRRSLITKDTNSVVAHQINFVYHKCKYSFYGCRKKMQLNEIILHEETCNERTVICPRNKCKKIIQIRKFNQHALKECAVSLKDKMNHRGGYSFTYSITNFQRNINMETKTMVTFTYDDNDFYFLISYLTSIKCFILTVMLPEKPITTSSYKVKITVQSEEDRKLIYEGNVVTIENLPSIESEDANLHYWFVAYNCMEPFITIDMNDILSIPIEVKLVKNGKKRRRT